MAASWGSSYQLFYVVSIFVRRLLPLSTTSKILPLPLRHPPGDDEPGGQLGVKREQMGPRRTLPASFAVAYKFQQHVVGQRRAQLLLMGKSAIV